MNVIGLTGLKGSGKDTAGAYLVEQYGYERMAFADPLKASAAAIFDFDQAIWDELKNEDDALVVVKNGPRIKVAEITAREFLQRYGTEAHREIFGQDFWVDAAMKAVDDRQGGFRTIRGAKIAVNEVKIVFTDCRFENEAKALRARGGKIIRIERPGTDADDAHASEVGLPEELVDVRLANDGKIEDLHVLLDHLFTLVAR